METFRKIIKIIIVIGFVAVSSYFIIGGEIGNRDFYKKRVAAKAVRQSDWMNKSRTFYLSDGHSISFMFSYKGEAINIWERLHIGDSIFKPENTDTYKVYRQDRRGKYHFYQEYIYGNPYGNSSYTYNTYVQ